MKWLVAVLVFCGVAYVECRPDGTTACDPALKPYVYDNTDDSATLISSPDYNQQLPYGPDLDCEWVINGGDKEVVFAFSSISAIEDCVDCACDSLEVYGVDSQSQEVLLYNFCGSLDDPFVDDYLSTKTTIFRFKTDSVGQTTGFAVSLTFQDAACERTAGMPVLTAPGYLTSPDFPSNYPADLTCRWNFQAAAGQVVQWEFITLQTEPGCVTGSGGFMFDYVEFFENNALDQSLGRWASGITQPGDSLQGWTFRSRTNVTSVRFVSDFSSVYQGFNISYSYVDA